ncbi:MAG: hypothetical protein QN144_10330, partial [Armatimonadota bacterium]|nr:hypothetical protein [Armatimonadota bacterium]
MRSAVEEALRGARRDEVVLWPAGSGQIPDGVPVFQIAYLPPDWEEGGESLAQLIASCGPGPRRYKNGLGLAVPDTSSFESARQAARAVLAIESLLSQRSRHNFSPEQTAELKERLGGSERKLTSLVGDGYGKVVLPLGVDEKGELRLETVDLETVLGLGRGLHQRIHDALAHHVFETLTPARLASVAGLSARDVAWCERLAEDFYTFFEFPKLWSLEPLKQAVAEGVANGLFAYSVGVREEGGEIKVDDADLIQLRTLFPADQVDLGPGTALLSLKAVERLRPPSEPAAGAVPEDVEAAAAAVPSERR